MSAGTDGTVTSQVFSIDGSNPTFDFASFYSSVSNSEDCEMQFHVSSSSSAIETPAEFKALSQSDGSSLTLAMIDDAYKENAAVYKFYIFAVVEASTQVKTVSHRFILIVESDTEDDGFSWTPRLIGDLSE
jgi:hypothetical protein